MKKHVLFISGLLISLTLILSSFNVAKNHNHSQQPVVTLNGHSSGCITLDELSSLTFIELRSVNQEQQNYMVKSFTLVGATAEKLPFLLRAKGGSLSPNMLRQIKTLDIHDRLIITDVVVKNDDEEFELDHGLTLEVCK